MTRKDSFLRVIGALLLFLSLSSCGYAQVAGGAISGTVSDPSKGVIPGAGVIIRNAATGVARTLVTNESGFYTAPNLLPGPYEITVTFSGFNTAVEKMDLTVGCRASRSATSLLGGLTEFGGGTGAIGEFTYHYTSYQVYDDLFLTRRGHSLKFGAAVERIQSNGFGTSNPAGRLGRAELGLPEDEAPALPAQPWEL